MGESYIHWLPLTHPLLGAWPATQACALTGNRTSDLLVHSPALNPLTHTSQGYSHLILKLEKNKRHFQRVILYYFKKGKNATEAHKQVWAVRGEGAVTD